jgi:hypothetical protein
VRRHVRSWQKLTLPLALLDARHRMRGGDARNFRHGNRPTPAEAKQYCYIVEADAALLLRIARALLLRLNAAACRR